MSDAVIQIEELSKQYIIGSNQGGRTSLRESLTNSFDNLAQKLFMQKRSTDEEHDRTDFWALEDVSFEVKQGERVGIVGRNGAGKSTLLKILSRIVEPTRGSVRIRGRVASLLEVGTGFHPELSGRENVFLNGAVLGMGRAEIKSKFEEIVAFAEIEKFLDTPVKRYSSGMYVRLAFAVAAHLDSEVLILDEVLAVGDAKFQKKCLGKISEVSTSGRTVLFVSHNMQPVRRLCTSAIYLDQGRTMGIVSVEDAIQQYTGRVDVDELQMDLDRVHRPEGFGQTARFLQIRLANNSQFCYGEPLSIIFTIRCNERVDGLSLGLGFDAMDGSRVMTLDLEQGIPEPLHLDPGEHEICFRLTRNPLHPGVYSLSASLFIETFPLDGIAEFAKWEVTSGSTDRISDRGFGGCRLEFEVIHRSALASV